MSQYKLTTPCDNCPFRTDVKPYLTSDRVDEIGDSLARSTFPCHKTTEFDDEGEAHETDKTQHCAGALIMLEKMGQPSQMMRIAERIGIYDRRKLNMDAPVFDDIGEMMDAQNE